MNTSSHQHSSNPAFTQVTLPANRNNVSREPAEASARTGPRLSSGLKFILTWTVGVLGVAAAIIFGIWAPLSYDATVQSNRESDQAQSSMLSAVSVANIQAASQQASQIYAMENLYSQATALLNVESSAVDMIGSLDAHATALLNIQSSAADAFQNLNSAVETLNRRISAMGELQLVDFCLTQLVILLLPLSGASDTYNLFIRGAVLAQNISQRYHLEAWCLTSRQPQPLHPHL
jgi:hypothetical protein